MPDLTIINNLDEAIHVAFFVAAPLKWKNNLEPGERWTTHLPTLPLYFQARYVERTDAETGILYRSCEFSSEDAGKLRATIGAACAAGTASVVIGTTSVFTGWGEIGVPLAWPLWATAHAGGAKYAAIRSGGNAVLCETWVCVPWFEHKEYSVRMVGVGERALWDVKDRKRV